MIDTSAAVQFRCEGCGMRITLIGVTLLPDHQLCSVCRFLCEHMADDPEGFWSAYTRCRWADRDPEHDGQQLASSRAIVRAKLGATRPAHEPPA